MIGTMRSRGYSLYVTNFRHDGSISQQLNSVVSDEWNIFTQFGAAIWKVRLNMRERSRTLLGEMVQKHIGVVVYLSAEAAMALFEATREIAIKTQRATC
jgi:hypothetical protein